MCMIDPKRKLYAQILFTQNNVLNITFPLFILPISYFVILRFIKNSVQFETQNYNNEENNVSLNTFNFINFIKNSTLVQNNAQKRVSRLGKVKYYVTINMILFLICWGPYSIIQLLVVYDLYINPVIFRSTQIFVVSYPLINNIFFIYYNKKIKKEFIQKLSCKKHSSNLNNGLKKTETIIS